MLGAEGRSELFSGYEVSLWEDGKLLEVDDGDGCTIWTDLMPLKCTLKRG